MKKYILYNVPIQIVLLIGLLSQPVNAKTGLDESRKKNQKANFTENKGQISDQYYNPRRDVLFVGNVNELTFHIRNNGISYQLIRVDTWDTDDVSASETNHITQPKKIPKGVTLYRLDVNWLGSDLNCTIQTDNAIAGYDNYYLPSCPSGVRNVKTYSGLTLKNVYKDIDIHYYEHEGNLKYDYLVSAHADYKQIRLEINGADSIGVDKNGRVFIKTELGTIEEGAPVVFQNKKQLPAKWVLKNNILSFQIDNYNSDLPLIIDPEVNREWGTYYGGGLADASFCSASDLLGNVFMTGYTCSATTSAIASTGAFKTYIADVRDAFIVKFNSDGVRQWGTYYGGLGSDFASFCSTDVTGNVYMTGTTTSGTGIATDSSFQSACGGCTGSGYGASRDAFLVKFNTLGERLWATYYGGTHDQESNACATDAAGNIYMAGITRPEAADTIATVGSQQPISGGGGYDAFLVKFNSSGTRLWGTFYGGSGNEGAYSILGYRYGACATDTKGNIYLAGQTYGGVSTDSIATPGSHQPGYGRNGDAFLVKFDSTGHRQWGTYYGASGQESGLSCATDLNDNVYMTGFTFLSAGWPSDSISTASGFQTSPGGVEDAFLVKFNSNGIRQWATFYGGDKMDYLSYCATDNLGNVYLAGNTQSESGIATADSWQSVFGGSEENDEDAYLVKFDSTGVRQWGTYYGSVAFDNAMGCSTDNFGSIFLTGGTYTDTLNVISSADGWQPTYGGGEHFGWFVGFGGDAYLGKFNNCGMANPTISLVGDTMLQSSSAATYEWYENGVLIPGATFQSYVPTENAQYVVCVTDHGGSCRVCSTPLNLATDIREYDLNNFMSVYPNPNNGEFEVSLQFRIQDNYTLELLNRFGQTLYKEELKNYKGNYTKFMNATKYDSGIYILRVQSGKGQSVKKVELIK